MLFQHFLRVACLLHVVLHVHPHAKVERTTLSLACLPCYCCCPCCCWCRYAVPSQWQAQYFPFAVSFHNTTASSHRYKTAHPWFVSTSSAGVKSLSLRLHHIIRVRQKISHIDISKYDCSTPCTPQLNVEVDDNCRPLLQKWLFVLKAAGYTRCAQH